MRDYIEIGSSPADEECVQVTRDGDYLPAMRLECRQYIQAIRAKLGEEPGSAELRIKSNGHDFGTYLEVVCSFDEDDGEGAKYAYRCESDAPKTWAEVGMERPAFAAVA